MSNLSIIFNKGGNTMTLQCNSTDSIKNVLNKYCVKAQIDINDYTFYYNGAKIPICDKTLFALNIMNLQSINVVNSKKVVGA